MARVKTGLVRLEDFSATNPDMLARFDALCAPVRAALEAAGAAGAAPLELSAEALAMLAGQLQVVMDTRCGRHAPTPKPVVRFPAYVFRDFSDEGPLAALLAAVLSYLRRIEGGDAAGAAHMQQQQQQLGKGGRGGKGARGGRRGGKGGRGGSGGAGGKRESSAVAGAGDLDDEAEGAAEDSDSDSRAALPSAALWEGFPDLTRAPDAQLSAILKHAETALLDKNLLRMPRISFDASVDKELRKDLTAKATALGATIVDTARTATHVVQFDPDVDGEVPSEADADYLRTLQLRPELGLAFVHWWYYPDSHDQWIPLVDVEGQAPPEPETERRSRFRVCCRFVRDAFIFNEWGNETDYEVDTGESQESSSAIAAAYAAEASASSSSGRGSKAGNNKSIAPGARFSNEPPPPHPSITTAGQQQQQQLLLQQQQRQLLEVQHEADAAGDGGKSGGRRSRGGRSSNDRKRLTTVGGDGQGKGAGQSDSGVDGNIAPSALVMDTGPAAKRARKLGEVLASRDQLKDVPRPFDDPHRKLVTAISLNNGTVLTVRDELPGKQAGRGGKQASKKHAGGSGSNNRGRSGEAMNGGRAKTEEFYDEDANPDSAAAAAAAAAAAGAPVVSADCPALPTLAAGRQLYTLNSHERGRAPTAPRLPAWFDRDAINEVERLHMPEFFDNRSTYKTPQSYAQARNLMVELYRQQPDTYLTATACRQRLCMDAATVFRLHEFLDAFGIINHSVPEQHLPTTRIRAAPDMLHTHPSTRRSVFRNDEEAHVLAATSSTAAVLAPHPTPPALPVGSVALPPDPVASAISGDAAPDGSGTHPWSVHDDEALLAAVDKCGDDWAAVAKEVNDRAAVKQSAAACLVRFLALDIERPLMDALQTERCDSQGSSKSNRCSSSSARSSSNSSSDDSDTGEAPMTLAHSVTKTAAATAAEAEAEEEAHAARTACASELLATLRSSMASGQSKASLLNQAEFQHSLPLLEALASQADAGATKCAMHAAWSYLHGNSSSKGGGGDSKPDSAAVIASGTAGLLAADALNRSLREWNASRELMLEALRTKLEKLEHKMDLVDRMEASLDLERQRLELDQRDFEVRQAEFNARKQPSGRR